MNNRIYPLNKANYKKGDSVLYWMSREQRIDDNWALIYALKKAIYENVPLCIVFTLTTLLYGKEERSLSFMVEGLKETEKRAKELGLSFKIVLSNSPASFISDYSKLINASSIICDFNPLRESLLEHIKLANIIDIPLIEIDSHNIVPCRYISQKQEYGAFTLRRKIEKVLPFNLVPLDDIELILKNKDISNGELIKNDWTKITKKFCSSKLNGQEIIKPGYSEGMKRLEKFIFEKLENYSRDRNNPNLDAQSGLSFYLHYGQISAQRVALSVSHFLGEANLKGSFLDELIVRKELSDNFCLYNVNYDKFDGFPAWAKHSLLMHSNDKREYLYSYEEFEKAETHQPLWNAAQKQLLKTGHIHGYLRMYWAKKILEWSITPASAIRYAVNLNDKFALDGRDPNGYAGCAWAIGGLHDRGWAEREIFGKIRYMNEKGCRRKFDVNEYVERWNG